jgi:hypothetical protein
VEKSFISLLKRINGWQMLFLILLIGTFLDALILHRLHVKEINLEDPNIPKGAWKKTIKDIGLVWKTHDSGLRLVPEQIMQFNTEMTRLMHNHSSWRTICPRRNGMMPSNDNFTLDNFGGPGTRKACHENVSL